MGDTETSTSDQVKKICEIIEARDKILLETDIKIKYFKDAVEAAEREIKELEKSRKRIADEDKTVDKQLEQIDLIKKRVKEGQEVAIQSIINHQTLEKMIAKELDVKQQETLRVEEEFRTIYHEAKLRLTENPLFKELENERVEFLKVDIKRRDLEVKIRNRKQIIAQKAEIQKKIFYNFFVGMAEDYLTEKKMDELQNLKMQEFVAIKKLYVLQENAKLRQKLGTPRDKVKSMANIIFGSQECNTEKPANKPERPQPKKLPQTLNEKLSTMFQPDEIQKAESPQKFRIIENRVVAPAFVAPQFLVPEKRKSTKSIDLSKKWQKMIRTSSSKERISSSQQSDKCSQESQASGVESAMVELGQTLEDNITEPSMETNETCKYSQESQKVSLVQTVEKVPIQYQMVESLNQVDEMMTIGDDPQPSLPTFTDQPPPITGIMKPRSILSPSESKVRQATSKQALTPKITFGEPSKSVRFNLESNPSPKEHKGMFGQPMFGNPFDFSFGHNAAQNTNREPLEQTPNLSNSFSMSVMDPTGNNSHTGIDFQSGENQSHLPIPEYSYTTEGEEHPFKTPEMPAFGGGGGSGGGFFSFGLKSVFPFQ